MGHVEFALPLARFAPGLDEFSILRELHDARVRLLAVSVGDEDVAIGRDQDIGRPIEGVGPVARDPGLAQRHQHLSIGTELDNRVALAVAVSAVGHPDVAVPVREQAVRPIDHAAGEARYQFAGGVEPLDRRDRRALAGLCAAPIVDPDAGSISIDVDSDRLPHTRPAGSFAQFSSARWGLGATLGSSACARPADKAIVATTATPSIDLNTITHVTSSLRRLHLRCSQTV